MIYLGSTFSMFAYLREKYHDKLFLSNQTKPSKVLDKDIQSNKGRIWKLFSLFDPQNMAEVHKWLQLCLRTNDKYPDIEIYCPLPTKYNNYSLFENVLLKSNFSM